MLFRHYIPGLLAAIVETCKITQKDNVEEVGV